MYELSYKQTNKTVRATKLTPPHTGTWSRLRRQDGARRTRDGRTDTTVTTVTALGRHGHAMRKPTRRRTRTSAASTPAARRASPPSALSTDPCSTHARRHRVSRMPSAARALNRVGRSGWSVRGGQHGAVAAPLQRPARPPSSPALAVGGGAARPRPVRDGGRHRTQSLAAAASCSALQLVAKSPSPAMRVAHRMHACWLRRLRACGPASSSWRCARAQELCAQLPDHVAPAGLYLVGSADETGC